MKSVTSILRYAALGLLLASSTSAAGDAADDDLYAPVPMWSYPEAETLRADMLAALPAVPLHIQARLQGKGKSGKLETEDQAEVEWLPAMDSLRAHYRVTDAFGGQPERLEIERPRDGGPARVAFFSGDPAVRIEDPDLYGRIRETDLTWMDLSLSFLWWTGGQTLARERLRGRTCWVVSVPAPEGSGGNPEHPGYARVKMWIDAKVCVLLQAEAYDAEGNMVRRLLVDSFKKIDEVWFIKDIDVHSFPSRHKTTLRVDSVEVVGGAAKPSKMGGEG